MKKKIFKATIARQTISLYRRKRSDDSKIFDSIIEESKKNNHSPGKELIQQLKEKIGFKEESEILEFLKHKALHDFGDWQGNLQEVIWWTLRDISQIFAHHI